MAPKKIARREGTFSNVFVKNNPYADAEMEGRRKWLGEYLDMVEDSYLSGLLGKMIAHTRLTDVEVERIDEIMSSVDLSELLVEVMLRGDQEKKKEKEVKRADVLDAVKHVVPQYDMERRILRIMDAGKGVLRGWEKKFVYGEEEDGDFTGEALLRQCRNRLGKLSPKQEIQVNRIEKMLKIKV